MKKDCCQDKNTILKLKDTHNFAMKIAYNFSQNFKLFVHYFQIFHFSFLKTTFEKYFLLDYPPPLQKSKHIYLLIRVFLI
jgi:hypothetical protein